MKLIEIIAAKPALQRLTETRFKNFSVARNLMSLRKAVDSELSFYSAEQRKIALSYAVLNEAGNPVFIDAQHIRLKDETSKAAFDAEMQALREMEVNITPVPVLETDFRNPDDFPSPDDMLALDGLVAFEEA